MQSVWLYCSVAASLLEPLIDYSVASYRMSKMKKSFVLFLAECTLDRSVQAKLNIEMGYEASY